MRTHIPISLSCLLLLFACSALAANYPPADHQGADLTLADGDVIWGEHTNIGTFTVPTSATVSLANQEEYSPGEAGGLTLSAQAIVVNGTLNGTACGFRGGAGGAVGCICACFGDPRPGEGPFGAGGKCGSSGGYLACGSNGDVSIDDTVADGSGGYGQPSSGCTSGLPGGAGGGHIKLTAAQTFASGPQARMLANGGAITEGPYGMNNSGAGGGVLIDTRQATSVTIAPGLLIQSLGGGTDPVNGGTVKLFIPQALAEADVTVSAGRVVRWSELSDVEVSVSAPESSTMGSLLLYNIELSNKGPGDAQNVYLTDVVSDNAVFMSSSSDAVTTFSSSSYAGGAVLAYFPVIHTGENKLLGVSVQPINTGPIINTAVISSARDPVSANDIAEVTTSIFQDSAARLYPPGNHHGADLTLADGDIIWGEHTNIGTLTVPTGAVVRVAKHSRFLPGTEGGVSLSASSINLNGSIDASECGYNGGLEYWEPFCTWGGRNPAEGPFGGRQPGYDVGECECDDGGYLACGTNADITTDTSVTFGSGSSAPHLLVACAKAFEGACGGGSIALTASGLFNAGPEAGLFANGGSADWDFGHWANGAGGGILLDARKASAVYFSRGFYAESLGGNNATINGGTIKLFVPANVAAKDIAVNAGRYFRKDFGSSATLYARSQTCKVSAKGNSCKIKVLVQYTSSPNTAGVSVAAATYDLAVISDPSNPESYVSRVYHGKTKRMKAGQLQQQVISRTFTGPLTGNYLLWRASGLDLCAIAGPLP